MVTASRFKIVEGSESLGFVCAVDPQTGRMLHLEATTGYPLYERTFQWVGPFFVHPEYGTIAPVRISVMESEVVSQAFKEQLGYLNETYHIGLDGERVRIL